MFPTKERDSGDQTVEETPEVDDLPVPVVQLDEGGGAGVNLEQEPRGGPHICIALICEVKMLARSLNMMYEYCYFGFCFQPSP